MGPITTAPQLALIQALVDDAVAKGATLHVGGRVMYAGAVGGAPAAAAAPADKAAGRGRRPSGVASASAPGRAPAMPVHDADVCGRGLFYAPTVLSGVTHAMRIANEEVFGPVMAIFCVPGNSDDAAVAMANATEYGLGATVFSGSPARANAIAARIRSGMVGVNAFGLNYLVQSLPFGGLRASGFDRFSGPEGLRACCSIKSVVTDLLPGVSIPTPIPGPLQYPLRPSAAALARALLRLQVEAGPVAKLRALGQLVAASLGGGGAAAEERGAKARKTA
jgi:acyl-CoA reductase-like NAD-dependent aldehyde dehydrogenase